MSGERTGRQVARNALLNLAGNIAPLAVGVLAMPTIIRRMGVDQFGVLSFAWAILGYFTLFDLGLGRATTKFIAEALARNESDRVQSVVWGSLALCLLFGLVGTVALVAASGLLAEHVFKIPVPLVAATARTFQVLAASLPAVLVSNTLRGALEADQRFGAVNAVKVPATIAMFVLPLVGVLTGMGLVGIVVLLALSRVATALAYFCLCASVFPTVLRPRTIDRAVVGPLLAYGGWVTASNLLGPILTYLDRFLLAAVVSAAAVAYYTAPYELVTRLWIFPVSVVATLFPAFSAGVSRPDRDDIVRLFGPATRYLLVLIGPVAIVLALFAHEIMRVWLGADFADRSATALAVLSVGVLVNSLAQVPFTLLQGIGRADLPAKFYAAELPFYALVAWLLIRRGGPSGAACAWTIRVIADAVLHFGAAWRVYPPARPAVAGDAALARSLAALGCLAVAGVLAVQLVPPLPARGASVGVLVAIFAIVVWQWVFTPTDRARLSSFLTTAARA